MPKPTAPAVTRSGRAAEGIRAAADTQELREHLGGWTASARC